MLFGGVGGLSLLWVAGGGGLLLLLVGSVSGPLSLFMSTDGELSLVNVTGYPGIFKDSPCPYPSNTIPIHKAMAFYRYESRVGYNPWVSKPV